MNAQQLTKLRARAKHFLDLFLGLREKYALLQPLAFDADLASRVGGGPQVRGHTILKNVLLQSCVQDLVKLSVDTSRQAPNAWNIMETLAGPGAKEALLADYTVVPPPQFTNDSPGADIVTDIRAAEKEVLVDRFEEEWAKLFQRWPRLRDSQRLSVFKTWRDKLIAHSDLHHQHGEYRLLDLSSEGLKWNDLGDLIGELQLVVDGVTVLSRSAGFAWGMLDEQTTEASNAFWALVGGEASSPGLGVRDREARP